MDKIIKKGLLLFFVAQCVIICFTLIGCQSKNPNEPNYWYGTYERYDDIYFTCSIPEFSPSAGYIVQLTQGGIDFRSNQGETVHLDVPWGVENYRSLRSTLDNLDSKVKLSAGEAKIGKLRYVCLPEVIWSEEAVDEQGKSHTKRMFHFTLPTQGSVVNNHFFNAPAEGDKADPKYDLMTYVIRWEMTLEDGRSGQFRFIVNYRRKK